jgi:hypothetical protein
MSINLSSYRDIQTNLFVKMDVPGYQVLTFSDYHKDFTIGATTYQALGELLTVTNTTDELRASPRDITVTISGIPNGNVSEILNNRINGSDVVIHRAFFNSTTGELLSITGNPAGKFHGIASNFEIADELSMGSDLGSVTISITVTSVVELLNNKTSGRRTNPTDFPSESSMSRVSALAKSNFNFGAPQ